MKWKSQTYIIKKIIKIHDPENIFACPFDSYALNVNTDNVDNKKKIKPSKIYVLSNKIY